MTASTRAAASAPGSAAAPAVVGESSSLDVTPGAVWRAARRPVLLTVLLLATGLVLALTAGGTGTGRLDPRAPEPAGSRAVAQVLGDRGVEVLRRTTTAGVRRVAAPGTTVLVTDPDLLADSQVRALLATGADLVVVAPTDAGRFAAAVSTAADSAPGVRLPGCRLGAARRAGAADTGGRGFAVAPGTRARLCYAEDGVPSLVRVQAAGGATVTLLGSPAPLTNGRFGEEGNAALALGLLGGQERLVWYLPSLADVPASAAQTSFYDLVPAGVWWALVQIAVAVLVLALWRARRLGPVVTEPLPVVVRAAETAEGRARLYRRAGARDTAAETLRAASRERLVPALGLPGAASPAAVVEAVAARARRPPGEVAGLLYGAAPADDPALVRLADELDALDREVRRP